MVITCRREIRRTSQGRGGSSGGHLLLKVEGDVGELLLDVADNLTLSGGGEGVTSLGEDLHQVVSEDRGQPDRDGGWRGEEHNPHRWAQCG